MAPITEFGVCVCVLETDCKTKRNKNEKLPLVQILVKKSSVPWKLMIIDFRLKLPASAIIL
jgi:hypothetical protein